MNIETERLLIRPFREEDRDALAELHANPDVRRYFPTTLNREESDAYFDRAQQALQKNGFHFVAAELKQTSEFIGILGIGRIDADICAVTPGHSGVEIGWQFLPKFWGQGLATEGAIACLQYGWDVAKLSEIVAISYKGGLASQRVMQKIGMRYDPKGDFDHPKFPLGHELRPHVLYRISNPNQL